MPRQYKLAPAMSHLSQLILATLPLFVVLVYFLYCAAVRPAKNYYVYYDDDNGAQQQLVNRDEPIIELSPMLYIFLAFFILWSCGTVYMFVFVPKRHKLIDSYVTEAKTIIGDVKYSPRRNWRYLCTIWKRFAPEYAVVSYRHPDPDADGLDTSSDNRYVITKKVRTYQPYSREKVSINYLPGLPRSGQPLSDIEYDYASFTETVHGRRDRSWGILLVMLFWVVFTLAGSIFVCCQMQRLDGEDLEIDARTGWITLAVMVLIVAPLVAFGGNWLRWNSHRKWLTERGQVVKAGSRNEIAARPGYEDDEPGCDSGAMCTTEGLCGANDIADDDSQTPYKEMV
mmetsp:Transcript_3023/g.6980  ORF Transcript_3023/g.6980 Transcript_3023/m.6980 type:complete len:341 (+) Transcript_3023:317-1339(+)|eukprot:CAMPEP_0178513954 /NCGR_PEP_ID=MMETSP0696-20121128/23760_1 /TAXON_ID=265572 /ORGANISM="Extubocellulus spinifer, Strain CCMP396" /LENGTH=340 /DNA_ID=CAMNT_0020144007 /DNA_START=274 /DNA_END=1296 /DNA_ORIENTATION=-